MLLAVQTRGRVFEVVIFVIEMTFLGHNPTWILAYAPHLV